MTNEAKSAARAAFTRDTGPLLSGLYAAALRMTRVPAEAEDLVQETLLLAYQNWGRFETGTNLKAWLHRIQVNAYITHYRRAKREKRALDLEADPSRRDLLLSTAQARLEGPDGGLLRAGLCPTVQSAVDALPEEFRMVVVLADLGELSYREIADALGCPMGTVMSRLHRGRRLLARRLGPVLGMPVPEPAMARAA